MTRYAYAVTDRGGVVMAVYSRRRDAEQRARIGKGERSLFVQAYDLDTGRHCWTFQLGTDGKRKGA